MKSKSDGKKGVNRILTVWKETKKGEQEVEQDDKERKWQNLRNEKQDEDNLKLYKKLAEIETLDSNLTPVMNNNNNEAESNVSSIWVCGVCESDNDETTNECMVCGMEND